MVQFSSPTEAKKAHDCTEAILNNRFIRVYYLRKEDFPFPLPPLHECSLEASCIGTLHTLPPVCNSLLPQCCNSNNASLLCGYNVVLLMHVAEPCDSGSYLPDHNVVLLPFALCPGPLATMLYSLLQGPVSVAVSSIHPADPFFSFSTNTTTTATVTSTEPHAPVHPTPDSSGGMAEAEPPSHVSASRANNVSNETRKVPTDYLVE